MAELKYKICHTCESSKDISLYPRNGKYFLKNCLECHRAIKNKKRKEKIGDKPILEIADLPNEIWKDVLGWEGIYLVSNLGRIKSFSWRQYKGNILKPQNQRGYRSVTLSHNGQHKMMMIHRIVANAFIPNPENKPTVNHIDTNRQNNIVSNLEWATSKEQIRHARLNGRFPDISGHKNPLALLDANQVIFIFNSNKINSELAKDFNVSSETIRSIKAGRRYGKTTGKEFVKKGIRRLTKEEVILIYKEKGTIREIGRNHRISSATVCCIKNKKYHCDIIDKI